MQMKTKRKLTLRLRPYKETKKVIKKGSVYQENITLVNINRHKGRKRQQYAGDQGSVPGLG